MKYIDFTLPSPAENLACDEALLQACETRNSDEILRFWEPKEPFVVVGYANQVVREVDLEACRKANIPVFRRCSGGGTVLQGAGCLNYTLVMKIGGSDALGGITGTNRLVMETHQRALQSLVDGRVRVQGHTDLTLDNRKFSGNAQRRLKHSLLFHGTFLLHFDIPQVGRFLQMPSKQPDYRKERAHGKFLTNLGLSAETVKSALRKVWNAGSPLKELPCVPSDLLQKYSSENWNLKF